MAVMLTLSKGLNLWKSHSELSEHAQGQPDCAGPAAGLSWLRQHVLLYCSHIVREKAITRQIVSINGIIVLSSVFFCSQVENTSAPKAILHSHFDCLQNISESSKSFDRSRGSHLQEWLRRACVLVQCPGGKTIRLVPHTVLHLQAWLSIDSTRRWKTGIPALTVDKSTTLMVSAKWKYLAKSFS